LYFVQLFAPVACDKKVVVSLLCVFVRRLICRFPAQHQQHNGVTAQDRHDPGYQAPQPLFCLDDPARRPNHRVVGGHQAPVSSVFSNRFADVRDHIGRDEGAHGVGLEQQQLPGQPRSRAPGAPGSGRLRFPPVLQCVGQPLSEARKKKASVI
jgi:hypothetical protein